MSNERARRYPVFSLNTVTRSPILQATWSKATSLLRSDGGAMPEEEHEEGARCGRGSSDQATEKCSRRSA
eukprot:scaffold117501_cov48-Phaeocystis_antarctica.AAC.1